MQITGLNPMADRYPSRPKKRCSRALTPDDLTNRVIIIDSNINDVNLRTVHDSIYPAPTGSESPPITLTVYIELQVIVGSSSTATPAFDVGSWPAGIPITVVVRGRVQGKGGKGADGAANNPLPGQDGGPAFYTRYPIDLTLNDGAGEIWGGGGGGGGGDRDNSKNGSAGAGGGGAGQVPGNGGAGGPVLRMAPLARPRPEARPAQATSAAMAVTAAAPRFLVTTGRDRIERRRRRGSAIDGLSFITKTGTGDIRGGQVN